MSSRVPDSWSEGFAIRRDDGLFVGDGGEWVVERRATIWRDKELAIMAVRALTSGHNYEIVEAKFVGCAECWHQEERSGLWIGPALLASILMLVGVSLFVRFVVF
jgi:hypothetical protein